MQPKLSAAATQVAMQPSTPAGPVAQLALPEFTSTAPTRPAVASKWRCPTVTGAATTRFDVYTAAPTAQIPAASREVATAMATSGLPLALIPALAAPQTNPPGSCADSIASLLIPLLYQGARRMLRGAKRGVSAALLYPSLLDVADARATDLELGRVVPRTVAPGNTDECRSMNPLYAELQWLPRVPKDFDFNARLKALERSTSTGPAGRELQSLASYALDLSQLAKLAKVIGRVRVEAQAGQSGGDLWSRWRRSGWPYSATRRST